MSSIVKLAGLSIQGMFADCLCGNGRSEFRVPAQESVTEYTGNVLQHPVQAFQFYPFPPTDSDPIFLGYRLRLDTMKMETFFR